MNTNETCLTLDPEYRLTAMESKDKATSELPFDSKQDLLPFTTWQDQRKCLRRSTWRLQALARIPSRFHPEQQDSNSFALLSYEAEVEWLSY